MQYYFIGKQPSQYQPVRRQPSFTPVKKLHRHEHTEKKTESGLSFKASNTDTLKLDNFIHNISIG